MSVQVARNRRSGSPESVFSMPGIAVHDDRNRCSASVGIGVHVRPEWVFMMGRNAHRARRPARLVLIDAMELAWQRAKYRGHQHLLLPRRSRARRPQHAAALAVATPAGPWRGSSDRMTR